MSENSQESRESAEAANVRPTVDDEGHGSFSVEDDPAGTSDPAELAGTAGPDDADPAYRPASNESDDA